MSCDATRCKRRSPLGRNVDLITPIDSEKWNRQLGRLDELNGQSAWFRVAGEWSVECPEFGVEVFGEDYVGGVVCALALESLSHRNHGSSILQWVKHDRDRSDLLAGAGNVRGRELAGGYGPAEGVGDLVGEKIGCMQDLAFLRPCAQ